MNGLIHMMRHAETAKNPEIPVQSWPLTDEGLRHAEELAATGIFDSVDRILSSSEGKAIKTAAVFADRLGIQIEQYSELRELDRSQVGFLANNEYLLSVERVLSQHDAVPGWESRESALVRFQSGVKRILKEGAFDEALVVSHGLVLSIYFANLLEVKDVFPRWKRLRFCSWGTVQGDLVIKDIV